MRRPSGDRPSRRCPDEAVPEPGGRYLCIVAGERKSAAFKLVLPFKGDVMLSLILSKAFLLAADDRITDPTILRQIG